MALPVEPSLLGARFYNQAIAIDPAATPLGVTFSNGGESVIGGL